MRGTIGVRYVSPLATGLLLIAALSACATPNVNAGNPTAEHPCPAWVDLPTNRHSNAESAYLGCSVDVNLKATVEDSRDLEHGRTLGPANGARESLAIGAYETGQTKPLPSSASPTPTIVFSGGSGAAQ